MNNPKAPFNSKFVTDNGGIRSVFTTWPNLPNLFPAYTLSYSAATGKPMESGKKKLFVLLVLLLLLITSLAASLVLAFLWFNAIQSEYSPNESSKISSSFDQVSLSQSPIRHPARPSAANHKPIGLSADHISSHLNHNDQNNPKSNFNSNGRSNGRQGGHHSTDQHSTVGHQTNHQTDHLTNRPTNLRQPISDRPANHEPSKPVNQRLPARTTSTPQSTSVEPVESANDDDGFGETAGDSQPPSNTQQQPPAVDKDDERLIDYYKNFKNELDRNRSNKIRHEEKLDGEFVEHHTLSDVPDDEADARELPVQPLQPPPNSNDNNNDNSNHNNENGGRPNEPTSSFGDDRSRTENLYLPEPLASLRAKQFCNLRPYGYPASARNASYDCRSSLDPSLISSYFCNDKFVIVAKINAVRQTAVGQAADPTERQLIGKYDVHIERILKRSPFLSVAFKKQGLTTNITLDLGRLSDELATNNAATCLGQPLELRPGQTYLLSGKISGLSAVSNNCDLQVDWLNDLDDEQRDQLVNWSASRTTFSHC